MRQTRTLEILARSGVPHDVRAFEATEFTAQEAAAKLGLSVEVVYKTLLVRGERRGLVFVLLPADARLSVSKLATALGDKRVALVDVEDLFRLTGYLKGGCSPLGAKRALPVVMDQSALSHPQISISAGRRGLQVLLDPRDLQWLTQALVADVKQD